MNSAQSRKFGPSFGAAASSIINQRGKAFGVMIFGALLAFEMFNFSTTEFALKDVLGDLAFMGIRWATILSIAFCGIDFAGIARLFTPEQGKDEPVEVWYLFGAWLLAAAMNATLTWWGVSVAINSHTIQGSAIVGAKTMQTVVPIFVAVMVWVIRILIIGTFSVAGERLFSQDTATSRRYSQPSGSIQRPAPQASSTSYGSARPVITTAANLQAASRTAQRPQQTAANPYAGKEPTYTNLSMSASQSTRQKSYIE